MNYTFTNNTENNKLSATKGKLNLESKPLKHLYSSNARIFHLNYEFLIKPSPFIAIDPLTGRHFIYNNDDKVLVFSHKPISKP